MLQNLHHHITTGSSRQVSSAHDGDQILNSTLQIMLSRAGSKAIPLSTHSQSFKHQTPKLPTFTPQPQAPSLNPKLVARQATQCQPCSFEGVAAKSAFLPFVWEAAPAFMTDRRALTDECIGSSSAVDALTWAPRLVH